jgi:hypothetical protein
MTRGFLAAGDPAPNKPPVMPPLPWAKRPLRRKPKREWASPQQSGLSSSNCQGLSEAASLRSGSPNLDMVTKRIQLWSGNNWSLNFIINQ